MKYKHRSPGRPQRKVLNIPLFQSMAQLSGAAGIPLRVLVESKNSGCMAFDHGRINLIEFLKWYFKNELSKAGEIEDNEDWGKRDKRAAALIREEKLQQMRDESIDFSDADRFLKKLMNQCFFSELERLQQEFPATLKGKTEIEISAECSAQLKKVKDSLRKQMEQWIEKKGKF